MTPWTHISQNNTMWQTTYDQNQCGSLKLNFSACCNYLNSVPRKEKTSSRMKSHQESTDAAVTGTSVPIFLSSLCPLAFSESTCI